MKQSLYSIHDKAIGTYSAPVAIPSERDAIESFRLSVNNPQSAHFKHPADFTLFKIGTFYMENGNIETIQPVLITNASALKGQNEISQETM